MRDVQEGDAVWVDLAPAANGRGSEEPPVWHAAVVLQRLQRGQVLVQLERADAEVVVHVSRVRRRGSGRRRR